MTGPRILLALVLLALPSAGAEAMVPEMVGFQGWLTDQTGAAVDEPAGIDLSFALYHDAEGGAPFWEDTYTSVPVEHGVFFVVLGAGANPLPSLQLDGLVKHLGITVQGQELDKRLQIVSVPYAMRAGSAATADFAQDAATLGGLGPDAFFQKSELSVVEVTETVSALQDQVVSLQQQLDLLGASLGECSSECAPEGATGCTEDGLARWTCGEKGDGDVCLEQITTSCEGQTLCVGGACVCKAATGTVCDGDAVREVDSCGAPGAVAETCAPGRCFDGACFDWRLETPLQLGNMNAVYVIDDEVYAVGNGGQALHYDGTSWVRRDTGTTKDLYALWGYSSFGNAVVYAVGAGGKTVKLEGGAWSTVNTGWYTTLRAITAGSSTDIWAVGDGGTILHFDGDDWSRFPWEDETPWATTTFRAVWLPPTGSKVWVGGDSGTILQLDAAWAQQATPAGTGSVRGIWGISEQTIWAVTTGSVAPESSGILQYGGSWAVSPTSPQVDFRAVWGRKSGEDISVLAVGSGASVYESDTVTWVLSQPVATSLGGSTFVSVHGGPVAGDRTWLLAADGRVAARDGSGSWQFPNVEVAVGGLWLENATSQWAVGDACLALRYEAGAWSRLPVPDCTADLHAIWFAGAGPLVAVGDGGTYLEWTGNAWAAAAGPPGSAANRDVWGSGPKAILVVRSSETWLYNGEAWQGTGGGGGVAGWGHSASDFYVVDGAAASVKHFDGSEWSSTGLGSGFKLTAIHGVTDQEVIAVGTQGAAFRRASGAWEDISIPADLRPPGVDANLQAVWVAPTGDLVAPAGAGYVFQRSGGVWSRERVYPAAALGAVHGKQPDVVVGGAGVVFRRQ